MIAGLAAVILLAVFGMPLFAVLGALTLFLFHGAGIAISSIAVEMYRLAEAPLLIAIPMFTFAGYLLAESRAPQRMVTAAQALFGWMPGGLAIVALVACALFTAFTGGSGVTIIAVGGLLLPALVAERYPEKFAHGLLTTSGSLGLLFPPSLPIIIYGYVAGVSVDRLFVAGVLPGVLLIVLLALYSARAAIAARVPRRAFSWREVRTSLRATAWEAVLPVVIVGGIYSGTVTVTEAASLTAAWAVFVECVIYRDVRVRDLPRILSQSMILVGGILIIIAVALALTNYLIDAEIPTRIFEWTQTHVHSKVLFLLLLNAFLLLIGCLMDEFSAILVVVPLIAPVAMQYGIDPIHLGIIFLVNLEMSYSIPPVGINLFIASLRFRRPVLDLYRASVPFLGLYLIALLVITYVPGLSLWLVRLFAVR